MSYTKVELLERCNAYLQKRMKRLRVRNAHNYKITLGVCVYEIWEFYLEDEHGRLFKAENFDKNYKNAVDVLIAGGYEKI